MPIWRSWSSWEMKVLASLVMVPGLSAKAVPASGALVSATMVRVKAMNRVNNLWVN